MILAVATDNPMSSNRGITPLFYPNLIPEPLTNPVGLADLPSDEFNPHAGYPG
jgi:hypothetical protein